MRAKLQGEIELPGDKSIVHRGILFSALSRGKSRVCSRSIGRDNLASLRIISQLGVRVRGTFDLRSFRLAEEEGIEERELGTGQVQLLLDSPGLEGLTAPLAVLNCGNSGTTARLLCGLLAGQSFSATLVGDASLSRRPFRRVVEPLSKMGAHFSADHLPLSIQGGALQGINFESELASAQVKTALILAGLQAKGVTRISEPYRSRDHSERLLGAMGAKIQSTLSEDGRNSLQLEAPATPEELRPFELQVPGDFSQAVFFMVAALLLPGSAAIIRNVGFNPTRRGAYDILRRMGANIRLQHERIVCGEEVVDLELCSSELQATEIGGQDIVRAIDEIPILAVAAACAQGETVIRDASELRVKESDRLKMVGALLRAEGTEVEEFADGLRITGRPEGGGKAQNEQMQHWKQEWQSSGDHRILMCGAVLDLIRKGSFITADQAAIETSFPDFSELFQSLLHGD